jgi:hypothetical protein
MERRRRFHLNLRETPLNFHVAGALMTLAGFLALPAAFAQHQHGGSNAGPADTRLVVPFSEALRAHTLANMRDHLSALQEIQAALATGAFERAADIAERRLGLTSLKLHGASELAPHMPAAMQAIGTEMHRAASRFAVEATNAGAAGDLRPPLAALSKVMVQCVACHQAFRLQ